MPQLLIPDRTRTFEIIAVLITATGKFIFMDYLDWRLPFILAAIIFWSCYIIYRSKTVPGITKYWGFRTQNFVKTTRIILPFALAALVLCIGIGLYQSTINTTWHIVPLLLLYPVWGIVQQFLLIALIVGNLQDFKNSRAPKIISIVVSALLFGLIHYPFIWLMVGTFVLAIFYGSVYLKERNIYVLGIFHGWLAALFFYTVANRDPFVETFGRLLNVAK
ncbi:MAG TPA: CPBP family intramembrane glutamic endopeptidase [Chitinophagaceae bacterium]|jgi:membrane protease YdiL (CAAX protease family)|nr:CPBP family intramembrane glutamic endopeptidase [Chitinophagaceae bacterium]